MASFLRLQTTHFFKSVILFLQQSSMWKMTLFETRGSVFHFTEHFWTGNGKITLISMKPKFKLILNGPIFHFHD